MSPSHCRGGGGGPQGAGTRWSRRSCAKVLAFWRERDPHINPPEGRRQSSGMGAYVHPRAQAQAQVLWPELTATPAVPAGRTTTVWPGGLGGGSARAQALWCQLGWERPGLGGGLRGLHARPGPTVAPLPVSHSRAYSEGAPAEGGVHWDWPFIC